MLNTCDNHNNCVIIYDIRDCPICEIVIEKEKIEEENQDLQEDIDEKNSTITDMEEADGVLQEQIVELQAQLGREAKNG